MVGLVRVPDQAPRTSCETLTARPFQVTVGVLVKPYMRSVVVEFVSPVSSRADPDRLAVRTRLGPDTMMVELLPISANCPNVPLPGIMGLQNVRAMRVSNAKIFVEPQVIKALPRSEILKVATIPY